MATQVLPPNQRAAARAGILKPLDATHDNSSWAWTAGSGISTAEDLARYVQVLVGGGLLNDALQKQRLASIRPINPDDPKDGLWPALAQFAGIRAHGRGSRLQPLMDTILDENHVIVEARRRRARWPRPAVEMDKASSATWTWPDPLIDA